MLSEQVRVVARTPYHPGYDRDCNPGACVFGEEWTDQHQGRFGNNGCDTREDVVRTQFRNIEMRWGSTCRIYEGVLPEPYTGERMTWRDDGYFIQIDHIYPLSVAWHSGAYAWSQQRRVTFANDITRELLAVAARANQTKQAQTPADWLPPNPRYRCTYLWKYLQVAHHYNLPITQADANTIDGQLDQC